MMSWLPRGRFAVSVSGLVIINAIGTLGYMVIEGAGFLDSLFMTVITLSTVGYEEVFPLSTSGAVFTLFLVVAGVGWMFYTITLAAQYVVEGQFGSRLGRRRMRDQIAKLDNHFIVCGFGRVGQEVAAHFKREGADFVIVESNPDVLEKAQGDGFLCLKGDVTRDEMLRAAGIERAKALIAAVGNDVDNVFVTLSARELRPDIFIAARASADDSESKLRRAGADRVVFPERLGGRRMAMTTLRPRLVDFIDTTMYGGSQDSILEHIAISANSPVVGMTVGEGQNYCGGGTIVATRRRDGMLTPNPSSETTLQAGDEVVVIGTQEQLRALEGSDAPFRNAG